jgi:hypothetical protein
MFHGISRSVSPAGTDERRKESGAGVEPNVSVSDEEAPLVTATSVRVLASFE